MAGRMEQFYTEALALYKDYKYPDLHKYIARKMTDWYKMFQFETNKAVADVGVKAEEVEEGAVVEAVVASGASLPPSLFSLTFPFSSYFVPSKRPSRRATCGSGVGSGGAGRAGRGACTHTKHVSDATRCCKRLGPLACAHPTLTHTHCIY